MLVKRPKSLTRKWLKKGAILFIAIEGLTFAASFGLWYTVNTNRDSRKYLKENFPPLLEAYYQAGEFFDKNNSRIRETDSAYWDANKKGYPGVNTQSKEHISKNQRFMNVLESASSVNKPLYRLKKEDIDKTLDK